MAIRVRNVKKSDPLKQYGVDFVVISASDRYTTNIFVPFKSRLQHLVAGVSASAAVSVWDFVNMSNSSTLVSGQSIAAFTVSNGDAKKVQFGYDLLISAGSLIKISVSSTNSAPNIYGQLILEKAE